jgi:hypothetical protein
VKCIGSSATGPSGGKGGVDAYLDDGTILPCRHVFNCAETGALALAKESGFGATFLELPFHGMYFKVKVFAPQHLLYALSDLAAPLLGVHWTIVVEGGAKLGPSAMFMLVDAHHPAPPPTAMPVAFKFGNLMVFVTKQPQLALAGMMHAVCDV